VYLPPPGGDRQVRGCPLISASAPLSRQTVGSGPHVRKGAGPNGLDRVARRAGVRRTDRAAGKVLSLIPRLVAIGAPYLFAVPG
jgi:hypothetical protein